MDVIIKGKIDSISCFKIRHMTLFGVESEARKGGSCLFEGLPDDILVAKDMLEQEKNMLVSAVMPRGTRSNPPTGESDSGFTMSFEFNGLSQSGVLCGEDFIRYRPFKDSPEEVPEDTEFDWGALVGKVGLGLLAVTAVAGMAAYGASLVFTGGGTAAFAPYIVGGLSAVGGSWFVTNQAEKDYMRGEVSGWTAYVASGLAGSAKGALAGGAFCMVPYAAPVLLNETGVLYAGSMLPVSEETMLSLTEAVLYSTAFSNIVIQGSKMAEDVTGKNPVKAVLGEELYHTAGELAKLGAGEIIIAGLHNPDFYVKNRKTAHFDQIPKVGEVEAKRRTVDEFDITVNAGKQGKHIVGNNNYVEGRSIFNGTVDDAQRLVGNFAGTGTRIGTNKERVDFGEVIGQYVDPITNEAIDTTVGIIHYSKTGTHIVPAQSIK